MKRSHKAISLSLALALSAGLSVPALAADTAAIQQNTPMGLQDTYTINGIIGRETCQIGAEIYDDSTGDKNIMFDLSETEPVDIYVVHLGEVADITGTNGCFVVSVKLENGKIYPNDSFDWTTTDPWANLQWETVPNPMDPSDPSIALTEFDGSVTLDKEGYYVISAWTYDGMYHVSEMARVLHVTSNGSTPTEPEQPAEPTGAFTDVPADAYYTAAVQWASEKGIAGGTSATKFSPTATCTKAQILTFLWRANGSPTPAGSNATVPAGKYYTDAANWALEKGLTDSFDADTPATRAATVTYLWKLAGAPAADSAAFTDVAADATYASAVAWAVKEGITAGTSASTFSPDNTCTRGQIVTFLYRDVFGESTGENSSSNNQTVTPNAGGNSYEQDISALMAEGYTREEAHEILELMAGGYSEESAKNLVRMTDEELEQQQKDFEEWVESVGGSYDPETGGVWLP